MDFNGEYASKDCITLHKQVYNLSTRTSSGDRVILKEEDLLDIETLSILVEATEKTQKPFLKRALRLYKYISAREDAFTYFRGILRQKIKTILRMTNKDVAFKLLDEAPCKNFDITES